MFARIATRTGVQLPSPPALFVHYPGSNPLSMNGFYYVYTLVSEIDDEIHYSGLTTDLRFRLAEHNRGKCSHTSKYTPWKIETAVAFRSEAEARRFERYLKTGSGQEFTRRHF